jgi:putative methyltransferase (TIGR04325 family)
VNGAATILHRVRRKLGRTIEAVLASPLVPGGAVRVSDANKGLPAFGKRLAKPYFVGRYSTMPEASAGGSSPFDSHAWVETATFVTEALLARSKSPDFTIDAHLLPFATLVAALGARKERVRILDFGGGVGDNFVQVDAILHEELKALVDYHIVDTPRNCVAGRELLKDQASRLHFHCEKPQGDFDLTLLCGTLTYIEGWQTLLAELAARTRGHMYIARTPANRSTPSFYVRQLMVPAAGPWAGRYIGSVGAAIINPEEIRTILTHAGFREDYFSILFSYGPEMTSSPQPFNAIVQAMASYSRKCT